MINVNDLKVGDKIGVSGFGWNNAAEIRVVAKRTATQVVLDDGSRWNKYGRKIGEGSTYQRQFLMSEQEAATRNAEERKRMKRLALIGKVRDLNFKNVSDEGLIAILQLANDHKL